MYTNFNRPPTPDPTKKERKAIHVSQKCAHGRECGEECVLFGLLWTGSLQHCYSCCSGSLSDIQKRHCVLTERERDRLCASQQAERLTGKQADRQVG